MKSSVPLLLASLGIASSVPAATFNVPAGDVPALKAAINSAAADGDDPDVIRLAAGSTYVLTTVEADDTGLPTLPGGLTIEGNGATIERSSVAGTPPFRLMRIDGDLAVVMNDLTLRNGESPEDGGAIYSEIGSEALILNRCELIGNSAVRGGAVYMDFFGEDLVATATLFEGNEASGGGGAIYVGALEGMTFTACTFRSNVATGSDGGAILTSDELAFTGCFFDRNRADLGRGGAIFTEDDLNVTGGQWMMNSALDGGAIWVEGAVNWSGGSLSGNVATRSGGDGGGIRHQGFEALFQEVSFLENISFDGGGIYSIGDLRVIDCRFEGNVIQGDGGGIFAGDTLVAEGCEFVGNSASASFGSGTAIQGDGDSVIFISDSIFTNNSNNAVNNSGQLEVSDSVFQGNSGRQGAAVVTQGNTGLATIRRTSFLNNRAEQTTGATGNAGAIVAFGGKLVVDRCYFKRNTAQTAGGAISNSASDITISRSVFIENEANGTGAGDGGGAVYSPSGSIRISNSTFTGNRSATRGGALSIGSAGDVIVDSCTIVANRAEGGDSSAGGGGINVLFNLLDMGNSIVSGNTAVSGAPDLRGTFDSLGFNFIGDTTGAILNGILMGNIIGGSPGLHDFVDTGDFTSSLTPTSGSRVIDAGRADTSTASVFDDQRGFTRPSDLSAVGNAAGSDGSDIGAVEVSAPDTPQSGPVPVVNTTDSGFDGTCGVEHCSLADALVEATAPGGSGVVRFDPAVFNASSTIVLNAPLPLLASDVQIEGPGSSLLTIARDVNAPAFRHFQIDEGRSIAISGLTLSNGIGTPLPGQSTALGGAIFNAGELWLEDITITDSTASLGGGIYSTGSLVIEGSRFLRNTVTSERNAIGGAVYSQTERPLIIDDSYFEENGGDFEVNDGIDFGGAVSSSRGSLFVSSSTFIRNKARGGSAIDSSSSLELMHCVFIDNASAISGPAVTTSGSFTRVDACLFEGNTSTAFRGAALSLRRPGVVTNSTFAGNTNTARDGGAIGAEGTLTLENCTFTGNSAPMGEGGAIYLDEDDFPVTIIRHCTIANNSARSGGGIRSSFASNTILSNTILAGNTASETGPDNVRGFFSQGFNLIGTLDGSFSFGQTADDLLGGSAALEALADNGGGVPTRALGAGSAAIDAGNPDFTAPPTTDQRGFPRVSNERLDIGAFEFTPFVARSFAQWASDNQLAGVNASATADPDRDGAENILEAIVGTDPNDGASIPQATLERQEATGRYRASITKDPTVSAGRLIGEAAADLTSFSESGVAVVKDSATVLVLESLFPELRHYFRFRSEDAPFSSAEGRMTDE